jgi:hypothetical protein
MVIVYRGLGMLAPGFGLLAALLMNVVSHRVFGVSYYEDNRWPKLTVFILAGAACLFVGVLRKRSGATGVEKPRDPLEAKAQPQTERAFDGSRDHLFFIPLHYWSIAYFGAAVFYAFKSGMFNGT